VLFSKLNQYKDTGEWSSQALVNQHMNLQHLSSSMYPAWRVIYEVSQQVTRLNCDRLESKFSKLLSSKQAQVFYNTQYAAQTERSTYKSSNIK
jgi:hypothetical protein